MAQKYTVRDLVRDALRDAGIIGVDATPDANEVADAVLWLCGRGASSITGQAIAVAGGEVM